MPHRYANTCRAMYSWKCATPKHKYIVTHSLAERKEENENRYGMHIQGNR